jgi:metal-dependent amidase/aminoacylase/carboxypeptidase family protein
MTFTAVSIASSSGFSFAWWSPWDESEFMQFVSDHQLADVRTAKEAMTGEDFGYMLKKYPQAACIINLMINGRICNFSFASEADFNSFDKLFNPAKEAMTGEDFGYMLKKYPGFMFWLGADSSHGLHPPART